MPSAAPLCFVLVGGLLGCQPDEPAEPSTGQSTRGDQPTLPSAGGSTGDFGGACIPCPATQFEEVEPGSELDAVVQEALSRLEGVREREVVWCDPCAAGACAATNLQATRPSLAFAGEATHFHVELRFVGPATLETCPAWMDGGYECSRQKLHLPMEVSLRTQDSLVNAEFAEDLVYVWGDWGFSGQIHRTLRPADLTSSLSDHVSGLEEVRWEMSVEPWGARFGVDLVGAKTGREADYLGTLSEEISDEGCNPQFRVYEGDAGADQDQPPSCDERLRYVEHLVDEVVLSSNAIDPCSTDGDCVELSLPFQSCAPRCPEAIPASQVDRASSSLIHESDMCTASVEQDCPVPEAVSCPDRGPPRCEDGRCVSGALLTAP